jgi:bis(5'-nucleosidyl)-tetraphosphatase
VADPLPSAKACGFVLVRPAPAGCEYLLLTNKNRSELGLPKGHAEQGESELATALRETEEETGLTDLAPDPWFRRTVHYPAQRRGTRYEKTVVYLLARLRSGEVRISEEHSDHRWAALADALAVLPYAALRDVVRDAALFLKDPGLFALEPATEAEADAHLLAQPHADARLVAHLRGGARLARTFATALAKAGLPVHVEAAAAGTLLHDVGRALGEHEDHQRVGLRHLRGTRLAAHGFACVSHFTKGAGFEELLAAGVERDVAEDFRRLIDGSALTWEERCAALADACMKGPTPVPPAERFRDLRGRYDAPALIDLQERRTGEIRAEIGAVLGADPLALVGLSA